MLRHAVRVNSLTELALTKLDVLDTFDEVRVCTGYTIDGEPVPGYPDLSEDLARVVPTYVTIPGWKTELRGCRSATDLPATARDFVATVEREAGVPVRIVGVGPERDDVLEWPSTMAGGAA
jgi:adenylosuccinate synthase